MSLFPAIVDAGPWKPLPVYEKTLANGLQVLVRQDKRAPIVAVQVLYRVGSAYEKPGETGISHALEHMMFRGTPDYPGEAFLKEISSVGGEFNAFTNEDMTVYHETVSKEYLPLCLQLEADRMRHLSLNAQDFAKEMEVIKEERRLRIDDNPYALTMEQLLAVAFSGGDYQHPVIGWPDDLRAMQVEQLRAWYQKWYVPNNAAVLVVGDVDPETVFQLAQTYFGEIPANTAVAKEVPLAHEALDPLGERKIEVRAPGRLPALMMGFLVPSVRNAQYSWEPHALSLLASILAEGNSARLHSVLIRSKALAVQADAQYDPFSRARSLFLLNAIPSGQNTTEELYQAFWQEITKLQNELVTKEELSKVKNLLRAKEVYKNDAILGLGLEAIMPLAFGEPSSAMIDWLQGLEEVTPEQLQQVAKQYLKPELATVATFVPQSVMQGNEHVHKKPS